MHVSRFMGWVSRAIPTHVNEGAAPTRATGVSEAMRPVTRDDIASPKIANQMNGWTTPSVYKPTVMV
jgi:hypothetical protein